MSAADDMTGTYGAVTRHATKEPPTMPTVRVTDDHLAKLGAIARKLGPKATHADAFAHAVDAAHAKHFGGDDAGSDGEDPPESERGEGEDAAPASKGEPAERWEDDGEWPKDGWGSPQVDPTKAVAAAESYIEKPSDDLRRRSGPGSRTRSRR